MVLQRGRPRQWRPILGASRALWDLTSLEDRSEHYFVLVNSEGRFERRLDSRLTVAYGSLTRLLLECLFYVSEDSL
jgi:hypothetical protein